MAHLALDQPPLVIPLNTFDVVFDQQLNRAVGIARPVDYVAYRSDQIKASGLKEVQRGLQTAVFAMNVAKNSGATQHAGFDVVSNRRGNGFHRSGFKKAGAKKARRAAGRMRKAE
jgi:hypothetical protein